MALFREYLTLAVNNMFEFVCPILNTQVKFKHCSAIRESLWMGKIVRNKEGEIIRGGCQACMRAGKCPAAEIIKQISYGKGNVPDDYGSTTPVVGKLRKDLLTKLAPIMVHPKLLDEFRVRDVERDLIESASERMHKLAGSAPASGSAKPAQAKRNAPRKTAEPTNVQKAAASGDLAAAIS